MPRGDGEGADIIDQAALPRRNQVGQGQLRLAALALLLLAQGLGSGLAFLTISTPAMFQDKNEELKPRKERARDSCS
jgi:hypothetical protein